MVKLKKALNVANILNQKIERIQFKGEMYEAFKEPQNKGVWFVWGASASGKSTFLLQLAKEFAKTMNTV
jgi:predicted PilT family ATPase